MRSYIKIYLKLALPAVLFLSVSCVKGEKFADESLLKAPGVYGHLDPIASDDDPATKATVDPATMQLGFELGDNINIWSSKGTLVIYSVEEITAGGGASFDGGGFTLTDGETYYSSYPLIASFKDKLRSLTTTYEGQVQTADGDPSHVADFTYTYASSPCTNGSASFAYHYLCRWLRFQLTLPQEMTVTELTVTADSDVFTLDGKVDVTTGTFTPGKMSNTMTLALDNVTVTDGVLNAFMAHAPYEACNIVVSVKDSEGNVYSSPVVAQAAATNLGKYRTINQTLAQAPDVAEIDGVRYKSLADAVAAVPTDGTSTTITMIGDETIPANVEISTQNNQKITLDLNGHTISKVGTVDSRCCIISNYADLTIKDSSDSAKDGTGTGKMTASPKDPDTGDIPTNAVDIIKNYGNLTIESGLFDVLEGSGTLNDVITNGEGGKLYISGGKLKNRIDNAQAVSMTLSSTTVSNDVYISGTAVIESNCYGVRVYYANGDANKGELIISGGVFNTMFQGVFSYSVNPINAANFIINISGGQFGGTGVYLASDTGFQEISITGGHFRDLMVSRQNKKFITGGEFETLYSFYANRFREDTMIADGYKMVLDGGLYIVVPESDPRPAGDFYPANTVYYYWPEDGIFMGRIVGFYVPFDGYDMLVCAGEYIRLLSNVTLSRDVPWIEEADWCTPLFQGGDLYLTFGEYDINLNGYAFALPTGVSVKTDRRTNIFTALQSGYSVVETAISEGDYHYMYSVTNSAGDDSMNLQIGDWGDGGSISGGAE